MNELRPMFLVLGTVKLCIRPKCETTSDVSALETALVGKLQKVLSENSDEKLWPHKPFNSANIRDIVILGAMQGEKVVELWLWCQSREGFEKLRDIDEGELIQITEQLFSEFQSTGSQKVGTAFIDSSYFQHNVGEYSN